MAAANGAIVADVSFESVWSVNAVDFYCARPAPPTAYVMPVRSSLVLDDG